MSDTETTEAPATEAPNTGTTNHLYLVDGSSYIFRAYHRLPPLTNRHGQPAGAVYGYTAMLWKLADGLNKADGPTHMAVILDASEQTFRNTMYDQYKAHRPPPPEDLVPQFPLIRTATRAFSIPCIETAGLEADDIIACYVTAAKAAGWRVTIVSSDKDLMQLIDEDAGIDMLDTMNDRRIGREQVLEKFGVPPEKVGDVLALMGDSVDNVPGVPGIGPKTASQLIQQYRRPRNGACEHRPDHQAEIEAVADRPCRQCAIVAASWCGWCATRRCPSRSRTLRSRASRPSR